MKLKMLAVAMVCALASVMIAESADAQHRRGRHGGGYGYDRGNARYCPPRHVAPRVYYNNNRGPRYVNRQVYRGYNNCPPRYTRIVHPRYATPPITNVYYGGNGYNQGGYYGGSGVSVNVNTPGFSGSFNSGRTW